MSPGWLVGRPRAGQDVVAPRRPLVMSREHGVGVVATCREIEVQVRCQTQGLAVARQVVVGREKARVEVRSHGRPGMKRGVEMGHSRIERVVRPGRRWRGPRVD